MSAPGLGYRPDIDGVRAIAVGLVVVFHFKLLPLGEAGFIGVDIFFVISGFLITRIILAGLEAGDFRLGGFYLARVRRLYPALITVLAGYLAAGYLVFLPDRFEELSIEALLSQFYVINIYFWKTVNYFGLQADSIPLLHMWSLGVEEQFYLFYPLFLILVFRLGRARLAAILTGVALASFALGWAASEWKPWAAFYLLPTRAWELLLGGLLALALRRGPLPAPVTLAAGPLGLGLIALALVLYRPDIAFPGWFAALPALGAAALLIPGRDGPTPVGRLLSLGPMVWIGRISYPLYLVHWPVIILMHDGLPEQGWGLRLGGLLLSVGLAWAITRHVEAPIRSRRVLGGTAPFLGAAGLTTALLVAATVLGIRSDGLPGRFDPEVTRLLAYSEDRAIRYEACNWPEAPCPIGPEGAPRLALIGDSHAQALAGAFDLWLAQRDMPGVLMFGSACLPVPGVGDRRCAAFAEAAIARAETSPTIDTVVLASIWRQPYEGAGLSVGDDFLSGEAAHQAFAAALEVTVRRLRAAGKRVVILEPLYAAPRPVPRTLARNLAFGSDWPVDVTLAEHRAQFARAFEAFDRAGAAGAERVSLIDDLCRDGICPATTEGAPLFWDNNHVRASLAPVFAARLAVVFPMEDARR